MAQHGGPGILFVQRCCQLVAGRFQDNLPARKDFLPNGTIHATPASKMSNERALGHSIANEGQRIRPLAAR
jgi:hypothetical protein